MIGGIFAARMRASRAGSLPMVAFFAGAAAASNALGRRREIDRSALPIVPVMW